MGAHAEVRVVRKGEGPSIRGDGSSSTEIFGPGNGSSDLATVTYACDPGFRTGPHHHTADSVCVITSGRAVFRWGSDLENEALLDPGDWLYVGAGVRHEELTPDDSPAEMIVVRNLGGGEVIFE